MQKSVLKINECHAFSTLECQGIYMLHSNQQHIPPGRRYCSISLDFSLKGGRFFRDKFFVDDLSSFCVLKEGSEGNLVG